MKAELYRDPQTKQSFISNYSRNRREKKSVRNEFENLSDFYQYMNLPKKVKVNTLKKNDSNKLFNDRNSEKIASKKFKVSE